MNTALSDSESAVESFNAAMAAAGETQQIIEQAPEKVVEPVKEPVAKASTNGTAPEKTDEFPDELVGGKEPVVAAPEEDPDAILNEVPKGQVKHEHFEKVQKTAKERVAAARAEADQLRAEVAKLKTAPSSELAPEHVKTLQALKAERDEALERAGRNDYAGTDEFQKRFTAKESRIAASLTATAEAVGADKETIAALPHLSLKKRMAMLDEAELNQSARSRIDVLLVEYDNLQEEKSEELTNWKANAASRQQRNAAQQQAQAEAEEREYETAFKEVSAELFEHEPFRLIEGNEKWNAVAMKNRANAEEIMKGNLSKKAVARAAGHAAGYETLLGMLRQAQTKNKDQAVRLSKYEKNSPSITSTPASTNSGRKMTDSEYAKLAWDEGHKAHAG